VMQSLNQASACLALANQRLHQHQHQKQDLEVSGLDSWTVMTKMMLLEEHIAVVLPILMTKTLLLVLRSICLPISPQSVVFPSVEVKTRTRPIFPTRRMRVAMEGRRLPEEPAPSPVYPVSRISMQQWRLPDAMSLP
jgi:hypothetical protein